MQRQVDLQGVEPKRDSCSVLPPSQRGQRSRGTSWMACALPSPTWHCGGTMPYCCSLSRPSGVIQSVVQAGARCSVTVTGPNSARAARTSSAISSVAGQPL